MQIRFSIINFYYKKKRHHLLIDYIILSSPKAFMYLKRMLKKHILNNKLFIIYKRSF